MREDQLTNFGEFMMTQGPWKQQSTNAMVMVDWTATTPDDDQVEVTVTLPQVSTLR